MYLELYSFVLHLVTLCTLRQPMLNTNQFLFKVDAKINNLRTAFIFEVHRLNSSIQFMYMCVSVSVYFISFFSDWFGCLLQTCQDSHAVFTKGIMLWLHMKAMYSALCLIGTSNFAFFFQSEKSKFRKLFAGIIILFNWQDKYIGSISYNTSYGLTLCDVFGKYARFVHYFAASSSSLLLLQVNSSLRSISIKQV